MIALKAACPCLFPDSTNEPKKLMELTPCKGSTSDDELSNSTIGARAQGLLGMAMAPVAKFQQRRVDEALRKERAAALMEGTNMRLLQSRGSTPVRIALSRDSAMVTYQSLDGPSESGVISLAIVREVKPIVVGGILRSQTPVPMQWMVRIPSDLMRAPSQKIYITHGTVLTRTLPEGGRGYPCAAASFPASVALGSSCSGAAAVQRPFSLGARSHYVQIVADDETLRLEAPTESLKEQWMTTLADLAKRQVRLALNYIPIRFLNVGIDVPA
jgi:hypothetical protein